MNYTNLVKFINYLIKIANRIKLIKCSESGKCLCDHCTNIRCKMRATTINEIK